MMHPELHPEVLAIARTFRNHDVEILNIDRFATPTFILYGITKAPTEKIKRIEALRDELANAITTHRGQRVHVRIQHPPIMIEVPREHPRALPWLAELAEKPFVAVAGRGYEWGIATTQTLNFNEPDMAHALIAATTGGGKTVLMQGMLLTMALSTPPSKCRFILIDPKRRGLTPFTSLPHTLRCAVTPEEISETVQMIIDESNRRRDRPNEKPPHWIAFIDELAQVPLEALKQLNEIALPLGREQHIHVVSATQHPTADVLGGSLAKRNYSVRFVGRVVDADAAQIATGRPKTGAELLPGRGAFVRVDHEPIVRFQAYKMSEMAFQSGVVAVFQRWQKQPSTNDMTWAVADETDAHADDLTNVFERYHDGNGGLQRGGIMAAIRTKYGEDVPSRGAGYVWRRDAVLQEFEAWR